MAEGMSRRLSQGYAHACQRAELLGLKAPTEDEWLNSDERAREVEALEQEEHDDAIAQVIIFTNSKFFLFSIYLIL